MVQAWPSGICTSIPPSPTDGRMRVELGNSRPMRTANTVSILSPPQLGHATSAIVLLTPRAEIAIRIDPAKSCDHQVGRPLASVGPAPNESSEQPHPPTLFVSIKVFVFDPTTREALWRVGTTPRI